MATKIGETLDLSSRELKNRTLSHMKLALAKQLKVKSRKPKGFICEMILPPLILCALLLGWSLSDDMEYPDQDFAGNRYINTTQSLRDTVCVKVNASSGRPVPNLGAAFTFDECPADNLCLFGIPVQDGSRAKLCPKGAADSKAEVIFKDFSQLLGDEAAEQPQTIPTFDAMVSIQQATRYAKDLLGYKIDTPLANGGWLEIVSSKGSCDDVRAVADHLNATTAMYDVLFNTTVDRKNPACNNLAFPTQDDAVDFIRSKEGADNVWGLVIINEVDTAAKRLDYTIRLNYTAAPFTTGNADKFSEGLGEKRAQQYINSGFATLVATLNSYIAKPQDADLAKYDFDFVTLPMPIMAYKESAFFQQAGTLIPLCLALAFLYPSSCLVSGIVLEKEARLREGMLIMGLQKSAFYSSWFLTYFIMLTISSILMTLITGLTYFQNTSALLLFILFELFCISMIGLGLLLSVFFSKAKIAAIAAPLVTFLFVVPKFSLGDDIAMSTKLAVSLLSPCAFGYGSDLVANYEKQGQGSGFSEFNADEYSYGTSIGMMILDIVLYHLLAIYLDMVLPSEYGVKLHPLFFVQKSYWVKTPSGESVNTNSRAPRRSAEHVETGFDEATQKAMAQRERVRVMGLRKEFRQNDRLLVAVDNFGNGLPGNAPGQGAGFPMYEGQIQCILGHNGAGKTTLINMMTGMLPASEGDCSVWGSSIRTDVQEIRRHIGYCPQHNILWDRMTVEEHLHFYGSLKGVTGSELEERTKQMLQLVNLYEKRGAWSSVLSGGQKRKLSVACALIGGSRLVFLDEPTAGMDVESRRAMWNLLRNPKVLEGRVIVLTTHYMEEADLLGDSVAIMHKGCLHSWGSPFFLKSQLGVGYNLSVTFRADGHPREVERVITEQLPRANTSRTSCTGNELRVLVPLVSEPTPEVKKEIVAKVLGMESYESVDKLKEALTRLADSGTDRQREAAEKVLEDIRTANAFPELFDELDASKQTLGIEGYGISVTTLEEVFLKIEMEGEGATNEYAADGTMSPPHSPRKRQDSAVELLLSSPKTGDASVGVDGRQDFKDLYSIKKQADAAWEPPITGGALMKTQFVGLFKKRARYGLRDRRAMCFQFALPVGMILFALWLGGLGPPVQPELLLESGVARVYGSTSENSVFVYAGVPTNADFFKDENFPGFSLLDITTQCGAPASFAGLSACLLADANNHTRDAPRGAAMWSPINGRVPPPQNASGGATLVDNAQSALYINASAVHGLPATLTAAYNAYLRDAAAPGANTGITVRNHPLPFSEERAALIEAFQVVITGLFIMIPFTLIPSNFVSYVVKEREGKSKHVQIISGANLGAYWASSFVFDFLSYCTTVLLAFIVFLMFNRKEFVGDAGAFSATLVLFLLYGAAAIAISYAMSFVFTTYTAAQNAAMIFHFFAGFIFVITVQILIFIESTEDVGKTLKWIFRCIPSYALGEGIIALSSRSLVKTITGSANSAWDFDVAGAPILFLCIALGVFSLLTILIEASGMKGSTLTFGDVKELFFGRQKTKPSFGGGYENQEDADVSVSNLEDGEKDPGDPDVVLRRKGAWLKCSDPASRNVFYFNESTGESKWTSRDTPFYEDPSVMAHANEVLSSTHKTSDDAVVVRHLRKVWPKRGNMTRDKVAVRDLSFAVQSGELFAFLGTNGAGKTTTLSVLSGEFPQTSGKAFIGGYDVVEQGAMAKQNLGFCPQFDACLELLTCEEHLDLFASLRGIPPAKVKPSIELLLNCLGLEPHRKKLSKNLSGGNRRKLSVAIALLGGPPVVFLDEPSAGMDPIARRGLWLALENAILDLKLSVVLTTHHLEEIEGLGRLKHRVTIMVDGKLQCLGPLSQLKNDFGDSYELVVKVNTQADEDRLEKFMKQNFPKAIMVESSQQRLTYSVLKAETNLSRIFRSVEDGRKELGIADYSINETSLEQVFVRISQRAMREEEAETYRQEMQTQVAKFPIRAPQGPIAQPVTQMGQEADIVEDEDITAVL